MQLIEAFEEFKRNLISEKNCSQKTLESYQHDFNNFINFLRLNQYSEGIKQITTPIMRQYISYLKIDKNYHTNTVRRKIHSASSFFNFLEENDYIVKSPMSPIHAPKEKKGLPIYLKSDELKKLVDAPERYCRLERHVLRDKAMLALFVYTGARRSEVIAMDWTDIDFGRKEIKITKGKGDKERRVPMIHPLDVILWDYLQERLPLTNKAVLITDTGNRISVSNMYNIIKTYIRKIGAGNKGYTIHKLRHSFATMLYQQGVDILVIKELLGHEDLNTTNIYTHTTVEHLRESVQKFPI